MYRVNFVGGTLDGGTAEYEKKIGGYIRIRTDDGKVEVYNRIFNGDEGVYSLESTDE